MIICRIANNTAAHDKHPTTPTQRCSQLLIILVVLPDLPAAAQLGARSEQEVKCSPCFNYALMKCTLRIQVHALVLA